MEHQYLITEKIPSLVPPPGKKEQLHVIDFEGELYLREERGAILIGTYERACVPWSVTETPWDFGQNLLPNDLERIEHVCFFKGPPDEERRQRLDERRCR